MANTKGTPKDIPDLAREIQALLVAYVKQETIDPIKGLGRFLALGAAGAVVGGLGLFLLVLGGIRLLQTETGSTFTGNLSFLPYVFAMVACGVVAGVALKAATAAPRRQRP